MYYFRLIIDYFANVSTSPEIKLMDRYFHIANVFHNIRYIFINCAFVFLDDFSISKIYQ